jgi:hypothetical protein
MDSTEMLNEIKNQLEQLEHKGYEKNSFKSGYLLGYAKALQLLQPDVIKSVCKHEYITDANWKSLTCRLCNNRIEPTQTVL